jgi:hypothetical protein
VSTVSCPLFPQLVGPRELTPGIPAVEYRERRKRLSQMLPPGATAILPAAATVYMSGVIPWPYRQVREYGKSAWRRPWQEGCTGRAPHTSVAADLTVGS